MKQMSTQMKWTFFVLTFSFVIQLFTNCSKANDGPEGDDDGTPQPGYLTGTVKDQAGNPLQGVHILVDHSIFFNSNLSTYTDAEGRYKIKLPNGSWYAFAMHDVSYQGNTFSLYLHPENPAGFGAEGGVRNFVWKLSGTMPQPLSGIYGGWVTIDNFPGVYIEETAIDFVFTPVGPLIDGSAGEVIRRRAEDAHNIKDIPIGRYQLTATYEGRPVKFRAWNSDAEFRETYDLQFKPQIAEQCDNCAMVEYYWEPL
ncbi:carboxypeptidase regulatory-like domain-containing protein [Parapedobacter sp. ISTM3]|uniref:Carboxypeptidase regulatory-like domain-containing protein n=1 Tax=Parapedobacter luteus TaxID=623280 RepID=A0A1T5EDK9_9SPHI|nr:MULTISPECIES: carboxypeptidase-like regulatory domain-containing protein [Parapedobacter]MBK1441185.1 carboxypeptidase regulatory-like domain-containing protein [Parapedobacter sp. ISTM3]SKB82016.1 Carboxypeptidase regulatory-like domain-containing protein [Parapedobacter luteus]